MRTLPTLLMGCLLAASSLALATTAPVATVAFTAEYNCGGARFVTWGPTRGSPVLYYTCNASVIALNTTTGGVLASIAYPVDETTGRPMAMNATNVVVPENVPDLLLVFTEQHGTVGYNVSGALAEPVLLWWAKDTWNGEMPVVRGPLHVNLAGDLLWYRRSNWRKVWNSFRALDIRTGKTVYNFASMGAGWQGQVDNGLLGWWRDYGFGSFNVDTMEIKMFKSTNLPLGGVTGVDQSLPDVILVIDPTMHKMTGDLIGYPNATTTFYSTLALADVPSESIAATTTVRAGSVDEVKFSSIRTFPLTLSSGVQTLLVCGLTADGSSVFVRAAQRQTSKVVLDMKVPLAAPQADIHCSDERGSFWAAGFFYAYDAQANSFAKTAVPGYPLVKPFAVGDKQSGNWIVPNESGFTYLAGNFSSRTVYPAPAGEAHTFQMGSLSGVTQTLSVVAGNTLTFYQL